MPLTNDEIREFLGQRSIAITVDTESHEMPRLLG
jgi:hypothetical protein